MNTTKFNPIQPSDSIGNWIDNLFHSTLADVIGSDNTVSSPSVNIVEHEKHYMLDLAAPGMIKQDFTISVEQDHLVIAAEKKTENEETEGRFTRREFNFGSFKKSFHLDDKINREGITATYEDGVLKVTLPKKEEVAQKPSSKTIEIQ